MPFYIPQSEVTPLPSSTGASTYHVWQMLPWLEPLYTEFEKNYDCEPLRAWASEHSWLPVVTIALYLIAIFGGRKVMENRKPFDLKAPLAAWNLFLCLFSLGGMIRVIPYLFYWSATMTFKEINCTEPVYTHGSRDVGLWTMMFIASKFFELIDTAFIVLRKKPLIFLHWYHHASVLMYTYFSSTQFHAGLYFVAMNYSVHTFMYGYFFLMAIHSVPKWFNPLWVTICQISQMFVGVYVVGSMTYYKFYDGGCAGAKTPLLYASLMMYGSYLYLFVDFAVKRFILTPKKKTVTKQKSVVKDVERKPKPLFVKQESAYDLDFNTNSDSDSDDFSTDLKKIQ